MYRILPKIVAVFCLVFTTAGCSNLLGPKADDPKPLQMKTSGCLKDLAANVSSWVSTGNPDIGGSVDCSVAAIDQFANHVQGQSKLVYTKGEISEFLAEMMTSPDSPEAGQTLAETQQLLRVKQILFGGADDILTKDELARLKSLLLRARPLLVDLTPNLPTLFLRSIKASVTDVTVAQNALMKIVDLLAGEFDANAVGRPEADFRDLLNTARQLKLVKDQVQAESWLPLAESLKVLVLGGETHQLRSREWAPMIRTMSRVWALALRFKYNFSDDAELLNKDFPVLESSVRDILAVLNEAVAAHDGSIPNEAFEKVIDALAHGVTHGSLIPYKITAETAKDLLPVVFGKVLYGRSYPNWERHSLHFGTEQLERLRTIANDWMSGQEQINAVIGDEREISIATFGKALSSAKLDRKDYPDATSFALAQRAQAQLLSFMTKGRPPLHDDRGRLVVEAKRDLPLMKRSDLNSINLTRIIIGSVLSGWTHDRSAADTQAGLLEAEVQEAYLDLRDLGRNLNFIDPRSTQAGIRTFMETAVFMSSSDGNSRMGLQEGSEWLQFVSSSGKLADRMYAEMEQSCAYPKIDILGNSKLDAACFRERFLKIWASHMPNLPRLVSWVRADGSGERGRQMLQALENAARTRGASNLPVDSSEFRTLVPIMHYLESVFARFDADQDGVLDNDEIWKAFPLLGPFIKKMANGQAESEKMQKFVLSYILEYGTVPRTDLGGKLKLGWWYLVHGLYSQSADRAKVLTVIGSFGQAAKNTRVTNIKKFHSENGDELRALLRTREPSTVSKITELFQCLPAAKAILARDMATNLDSVAPADGLDDGEFVTVMKDMIDHDSSLDNYCLPF